MTTETLELLLSKLPESARKYFMVPNIPHNLISEGKLVDAGCSIYFYKHGAEIEYKGENYTEDVGINQLDLGDLT